MSGASKLPARAMDVVMRRLSEFLGATLNLFAHAVFDFFEDNCGQMAAAIAYFVLFSLFPLLIFLVAILGLILGGRPTERRQLIDAALTYLPRFGTGSQDVVRSTIESITGSRGFSLLGLVAMLWAASSMFNAVRYSVKKAFGVQRSRPHVQQKLLDLLMVGITGVLFLASIVTTALLAAAEHVSLAIPVVGAFTEQPSQVWRAASYVVPIGFAFIAFAALYRFGPDSPNVRLADIWPGALFASLLFEGIQAGFAFYVQYLSHYNLIYGALGAVVAFLFWVYLSAVILLFGAELAAEYARLRRGEYDLEPQIPRGEHARSLVRGMFVKQRPSPPSGDPRQREDRLGS
jgi:membrane protein